MKLGLGTVQFGTNYGISNTQGQTTRDEVAQLLRVAEENKLEFIDTAPGYGSSEEVLGQTLSQNHKFKIVTKSAKVSSAHELKTRFEQSLRALNQKSVYGLLIHQADDLLLEPQGSSVYEGLLDLKAQGKVQKIGVSVYSEEQIRKSIELYNIDLIQLPVSVFDQRLIKNNLLKELKERKIEIHARSVFLQGLILMNPEEVPPFLSSVKNHLRQWRETLEKLDLSPREAALAFIQGTLEIDSMILGVNSTSQLLENIQAYKTNLTRPKINFDSVALGDPKVLNPALWNQ